jgi:hypothetical protein
VDLQLSVLVRVDPDHRRVRLVTTGCLTETNQQVLYPLIHRLRTLTPDTEVLIDLTAVDHLEDTALDLLCWEVEHEDTTCSTHPVRFALTEPPPPERPSLPPACPAHRTGSTAWTPPAVDSAPATTIHRHNGPERLPLYARSKLTKGKMMTTPSARSADRPTRRSPVRTAALLYGAVFLLVGAAGFIPGITSNYDTLQFAGHHSQAMLMGVFQVSIVHNLVHLLYGVAGIALARSVSGARNYLRWGGAVYLLLWLYGLLIDKESGANFVPVNTADDGLHLLLGVTMVGLSFLDRRAHDRTRA